MPITIKDVKVITTQYNKQRLVIVKIITSENGLYGLGCATFTQRYQAVVAALKGHIIPFVLGRDVSRIEEMFNMLMVSGYWRNGPVLNNAISGIDQALWDIKGKLANMPVYDLLGGKSREAAHVYVHADGSEPQEVADNVKAFQEQGYRYIRVQMGGYGGKTNMAGFGIGNSNTVAEDRDVMILPDNAPSGAYFDPRAYMRNMLKMMEHVRSEVGTSVELLHDVHERLGTINAVQFAKDVEPFKLFFLEDILAPEDLEWFERIRQQTTTALAMGELFNNPREWQPLIANKLIDFIRMHVSQMGGITPARNVTLLANHYGIRTAWHGPADTSPIGHAANLHLDIWAPNFGVQEWCRFNDVAYEMFPGLPEVRNGYMYPNDKPGLGIDINEKLAAKYPCEDFVEEWTQTRLPDGSPSRP
ncbi:MAG: bifunctional D-altronate/D-mannonate dehydratase [Trueperaceae bacterium]|nr:bifunctional D-altronate/D-mannonate dehydratase [Trueperaceae bacterium]